MEEQNRNILLITSKIIHRICTNCLFQLKFMFLSKQGTLSYGYMEITKFWVAPNFMKNETTIANTSLYTRIGKVTS